jgi:type II secretion system protein E
VTEAVQTLTIRDVRTASVLDDRLASEYLEHWGVLPVRREGDRLLVASWKEDVDVQTLDDLAIIFDAGVELSLLPEDEVRNAIRRLYSGDVFKPDELAPDPDEIRVDISSAPALDDLVSLANEAPVVKIVNMLLLEALESRASDVHLECQVDTLRVRYRIDGVLQDVPSPPPHLRTAVVSRVKIMAELDIAERRVPQDGRIRLRMRDRNVDVRVSTLPALHGESVVLRLLDKDGGRIALEDIGMDPDTLARFGAAIARPNGIVLATGPTGSGKTTTLYAAVDRIRTGREKILTVEDPVEYELTGVPQIPVNEKVGLTFAAALRALLRQDPDILLVGEIRDHETAEIATHAALTGHLVLSTLHTNDAATALTRLTDLGVAPFLVASTVEAILAQRLVRRVCEHCAERRHPSDETRSALEKMGFALDEVCEGRGCSECRGTGYRGRTGIYELLVMNEDLRTLLGVRPSATELARVAKGAGMRMLADDGVRQIRAGVTTPEEVLRVTRL